MQRFPAEIIASGGVRIDKPKPPEFQVCSKCEKNRGDNRCVTPTPIETDSKRTDTWAAYLARWYLNYPCRLELRTQRQELGNGTWYLRIQFIYPDERDVETGQLLISKPNLGLGLWPPSMFPDEETPRWIRANLLYHLNHELDEHLTFDGQRPFDPHHESEYTCERCLKEND